MTEPVRIIKLMPDYECWPLWEASPGQIGNIDPSSLAISEELKAELARWAESFDNVLVWDDPATSGFSSMDQLVKFRADGFGLAMSLQRQLGHKFMVRIHFPETLAQLR
jgi:hypothetical protein